jgi:hypothetical protein
MAGKAFCTNCTNWAENQRPHQIAAFGVTIHLQPLGFAAGIAMLGDDPRVRVGVPGGQNRYERQRLVIRTADFPLR